jgi:dihydroceramidase
LQAYYLSAKDPVFHQVAYGIMTATIVIRSMTVMEYDLRPALRQRNPEECDEIMKEMWKLALTG